MKNDKTILAANILLPKFHSDAAKMRKWSVIACDQFTSDKGYWLDLEREIGDAPSTLRLIYPEAFLSEPEPEKRIDKINSTMDEYLSGGVFTAFENGFIITERTTKYRKEKRYGIVLAVDLEKYSYEKKSDAAIRASEATVPERLPPRIKIRRGAKIELPHVMLLYNAKEEEILGEFFANNRLIGGDLVYDFDLNAHGGHLSGYFYGGDKAKKIEENLYRTSGEMLFAVGDGNHSLATAKKCWEEIKETLPENERETHPARFALAEAVSLYSPALVFEPIYRFVSGADKEKLIAFIKSDEKLASAKEIRKNVFSFGEGDQVELIRALDKRIAEYLTDNRGEVDYIHGESALDALSENGVGFLNGTVAKDGFFAEIEKNGSLPKKTFSMGEGREKRYYTECKKISD